MQAIISRNRGIEVLTDLFFDRLIYSTIIFAALLAAVYLHAA